MALRQAGLIFRAEVAASLVITPRAGEAFRVRSIFVDNSSVVAPAAQHLTVINDTARVGFFRVNFGLGGAHLMQPRAIDNDQLNKVTNLLELMKKLFAFAGYPVVQGEALTLSLDTGTADIFAIADSFDAADIKSDMPSGSKSTDIMFLNYGTNGSAITAAQYTKLDTSRNPAEMVRFPYGAPGAGLVPAGRKISVLWVGGQPCGRFNAAGVNMNTQYLRPRVGSAPAQTILDRADVGLPFIGTVPAAAGVDYTAIRSALASVPFPDQAWLDPFPQLDFGPNDEFSLQISTQITGAGSLSANDIDLWVLLHLTPLGG